jgi:transcriptional regulator with XRE-family HTH domain
MKTNKQTHIAKKAGITDGFLSQILTGIRTPAWETAKKLFEVTGIPPEIWMEARNNPEQIKHLVKELNKNE